MGSGGCVVACPENVLGIVHGQAVVVAGAKCVGHGACVTACPVDAIELVFGSKKQAIDIPARSPQFETNVPGLYVAGELGGMGLIANAIEQGVQAVDNALNKPVPTQDGVDVLIVGAGPAGVAAAMRAIERKASYLLLDQDEFGGSIRHYPRQKLVMTRPVTLPGYGKLHFKTARKEELIETLEKAAETTGLQMTRGRVESVLPCPEGFLVATPHEEYVAQRVLLCLGRRGSPRKVGCPGEDLEKVAYRLVDPEKYAYQHILIVGAGDSAVEAAVALGEQPGNRVTLSYRGTKIHRPKEENLQRLKASEAAGQVTLVLGSTVRRIDVDRVVLQQGDEEHVLPNDFVFVFAGGVLPTALLTGAGIQIERHHGKEVVVAEAAAASQGP
jgi:thioredoxin reductase